MITLTREEAQQVLETIVSQYEHPPINVPIIELLRARLAQPEPEPVAWLDSDGFPWSKEGVECRSTKDTYEPLYTAPPQREWQGLTDEEQLEIMKQFGPGQRKLFADAIEAKLKEKNSG
jgi:hypothetical protein